MPRKSLVALAAAAVAVLLAAAAIGADAATPTKLSATLTTGQEVPKPNAQGGSGTFTGTLSGRKVTWKLTFRKLTGRAMSAHIHLGKRGKAGPVGAPLCGPCTSGMRRTITVSAKVANAIRAGGAYANVHTQKNAAGEIRGQIKAG
jgi:opacity protein-like surface antigen